MNTIIEISVKDFLAAAKEQGMLAQRHHVTKAVIKGVIKPEKTFSGGYLYTSDMIEPFLTWFKEFKNGENS